MQECPRAHLASHEPARCYWCGGYAAGREDVQWRVGNLALDREWLAIRLREILDDEWCGTRYDAGVVADALIKAMKEEA